MRYVILCGLIMIAPQWPLRAQAGTPDPENSKILQTREAVWRAWFAGDEPTLRALVPPEAIALSPSEEHWLKQQEIIDGAREFHSDGGKLIDLKFPQTSIQRYGDAAFVYSEFVLEISVNGKRSVSRGRATEVFVRRNGAWINPGWHTDKR